MARNYWAIADTHFNHANILKFLTDSGDHVRAFDSLQQMNEIMIQNWNEVVRPGDYVYHLGDVFFGPKDWFASNWPRLMGRKRLIVGNHDDIKYLSNGAFFDKILMWHAFDRLLMTHVPIHQSNIRSMKTGEPMLNVHGHIHAQKSPKGPYHCVCVEQTNYRPVNVDELLAHARALAS